VLEFCAGERIGLLFGIVFLLFETSSVPAVLLANVLACFIMSFYCSCAPSLVALRAGHERVFILFCNICISSYFWLVFSLLYFPTSHSIPVWLRGHGGAIGWPCIRECGSSVQQLC